MRPRKVFGPNPTKMLHAKHIDKISAPNWTKTRAGRFAECATRPLTKAAIMPRSIQAASLAAPVRLQDAKSICARVTNDDRVRRLPITLVPAARQLFGFSADTPSGYVRKGTSFRCMNGKVFLCNTGANLVCGKANTSRTAAGTEDFCKQTLVGCRPHGRHGSYYTRTEWKCVGNKAVISKQAEWSIHGLHNRKLEAAGLKVATKQKAARNQPRPPRLGARPHHPRGA
jgi:hypothetical protein